MLEGPCICHHLFPGDLPNVPACKYRVSWGHKLLSVKVWQCRGSLESNLLWTQFLQLPWESKGCPHLSGQLPVVIFPGTVDSSIHHSGVPHLSTFHRTHWPKSKTAGSGGIFSPSSSKVSSNPLRKKATINFSSGGSSKSEPLPLDPSSPGCVLGLVEWLGAGSSANWTWWHLFFCPSLLGLWWSLLLDLALNWEQFLVWLSLSISSSRVATMASAVARLHSMVLSFLLLWGVLPLEGWEPPGWGCTVASGVLSSSLFGWSGREAITSSSMPGSPGGDLGSLCNLHTSKYISSSSSLVLSGPTSWMVGMPASGFSQGMFCWWPWQTIHSASFCPSTAACLNISYSITKRWGLSSAHLFWISRNSSMSITLYVSLTGFCSSVDHHFATWNFSCLLWYLATISLW